MAARRRTQELARRSGFEDTEEAAAAGTLYGPPEEIAAKLQVLKDVGVEYILVNSPGGIKTLQRFANEVMPDFK